MWDNVNNARSSTACTHAKNPQRCMEEIYVNEKHT
jgi:hypothetical protein